MLFSYQEDRNLYFSMKSDESLTTLDADLIYSNFRLLQLIFQKCQLFCPWRRGKKSAAHSKV